MLKVYGMAFRKHEDIGSVISDVYFVNGKLITPPFLFPESPGNNIESWAYCGLHDLIVMTQK